MIRMDKIITLQDYFNQLHDLYYYLWAKAISVGHAPQIILHWSAGRYYQIFKDYHISIDGTGVLHQTHELKTIVNATYKHNTGTISICLCCAYGATPDNLGDYLPNSRQIETLSRMIAIFSNSLLVPVNSDHDLTHGEVADNEDGTNFYEPYGPKTTCERWDLEYLGTRESPIFDPFNKDGKRGGDIFRGKALWYLNQPNIF